MLDSLNQIACSLNIIFFWLSFIIGFPFHLTSVISFTKPGSPTARSKWDGDRVVRYENSYQYWYFAKYVFNINISNTPSCGTHLWWYNIWWSGKWKQKKGFLKFSRSTNSFLVVVEINSQSSEFLPQAMLMHIGLRVDNLWHFQKKLSRKLENWQELISSGIFKQEFVSLQKRRGWVDNIFRKLEKMHSFFLFFSP